MEGSLCSCSLNLSLFGALRAVLARRGGTEGRGEAVLADRTHSTKEGSSRVHFDVPSAVTIETLKCGFPDKERYLNYTNCICSEW